MLKLAQTPKMRLAIRRDPEGVDIILAAEKAIAGSHRETLKIIAAVASPTQLYEMLAAVSNTHPVALAKDLLTDHPDLDATLEQSQILLRSISEAEQADRGITPLMRVLYPRSNIDDLLGHMLEDQGWEDLVENLMNLAIEMGDPRIHGWMTERVATAAPQAAARLATIQRAQDRENRAIDGPPPESKRARLRP